MNRLRPPEDVLICADVLGAFGVTPAEVSDGDRSTERSLEDALAAALEDARDRTATVRQAICRSSRGVDVSARYATDALERELSAAFAAVDWSLSVSVIERGRARTLEATGPTGRRREATIVYPETPLGTDNFPAVLDGINDVLFDGVDAGFVLLSSGRDRWRAALVETDALAGLRERYGERIEAFDRPLLPERGIDAYARAEDGDAADTWPAWALEREESPPSSTADGCARAAVAPLVEEAEPDRDGVRGDPRGPDVTTGSDVAGRPTDSNDGPLDADGWTLEGTVGWTRRQDGPSTDRTRHSSMVSRRDRTETDDSGFGELSGSAQTTRVSNDSFGTGAGSRDDDQRFLALGAALERGGDVSVRGLLEDEEFLPEIPAAEPTETRIEFEEAFDPVAVSRASAAAEQSGFEWVDAGSVETTRISSGSSDD